MHIMPYIIHHRSLRVVKLNCTLFIETSHDFKYCNNIKLQLKLLNAYSIFVHNFTAEYKILFTGEGTSNPFQNFCLGNLEEPGGLQSMGLQRILEWVAKNTGVGCHFLLQEIFPTQGSNPGLLHCRQIFFFHLSHQGSQKA